MTRRRNEDKREGHHKRKTNVRKTKIRTPLNRNETRKEEKGKGTGFKEKVREGKTGILRENKRRPGRRRRRRNRRRERRTRVGKKKKKRKRKKYEEKGEK